MAKAKTKAAAAVPQSREEVQSWITLLGQEQRALELQRNVMNEEIAAITDRFAVPLDAGATKCEELLEGIATWCEANKADLTVDSKTVNLITGEVRWKIDPPSVSFKKGVKLEDIIALIKQLRLSKLFIRTKEEVDKEAILRAEPRLQKRLTAAGTIRINRDRETFSVTPFGQEAP